MKTTPSQYAVTNVGRISAIVTAYKRIEQTLDTIKRIEKCHPPPDELLVHVDGDQTACAEAIRTAFPHLNIILSEAPVGPGGGRNKLIAAARNELIASFDDDSYPIDSDFFLRVLTVADTFPRAATIAATIFHIGEGVPKALPDAGPTSGFVSCGVIFRRSSFLAAGGFVPLSLAYGMEEEDLALRLIENGQELYKTGWLRVFHDSDLSHHASARITSATISNLALLVWLRYPYRYWPYGFLQIVNRVAWCLRVGRHAGVLAGLNAIPAHIKRHRQLRCPVSVNTMKRRFRLRKAMNMPMGLIEQPPAPGGPGRS